MANPLRDSDPLSFYKDKSKVKWIVLVASLLISIGSIYYTNYLVEQLKETERRFINLFARSLEHTINEDANLTFLTQEIIAPNNSIPVIWADSQGEPFDYRNLRIDSTGGNESIREQLIAELEIMKRIYDPIPIMISEDSEYQFIYYKNSFLLTQLIFYPYIQLSVIAIFAFIAYLAFSYSRAAEQNQVWVGLAKETAHQLGTPISSLMAWVEHLRLENSDKNREIIDELDKDISRLQMITERFSSIGSVPVMKEENITQVVNQVGAYLRTRISSKVNLEVSSLSDNIIAKINAPLFEWVIENLCKNAVDAMSGIGNLQIRIMRGSDYKVIIDISDNGKGIPKSAFSKVFHPGFTTKKRGWGLGLALSRRIIENYHNGRLFVKNSEPDKGTVFRIELSTR
ncbi:MAG TPA: ATP-binding protein [Cyclobacteriaceae bacterium]|jgi:signal transduction histidine kinase